MILHPVYILHEIASVDTVSIYALGFQCTGAVAGRELEVEAHIGLEQEFFLVPREAYLTRPDIQVLRNM